MVVSPRSGCPRIQAVMFTHQRWMIRLEFGNMTLGILDRLECKPFVVGVRVLLVLFDMLQDCASVTHDLFSSASRVISHNSSLPGAKLLTRLESPAGLFVVLAHVVLALVKFLAGCVQVLDIPHWVAAIRAVHVRFFKSLAVRSTCRKKSRPCDCPPCNVRTCFLRHDPFRMHKPCVSPLLDLLPGRSL